MAVLVLLAGCGFISRPGLTREGAGVLETAAKPTPITVPLGDCGPEGSAPDHALNMLKNRVDEGAWRDVPWPVIAHLPWPRNTSLRFRNLWTEGQRDEVGRYEGAAVRVDGYLDGYQLEGPEPPNCYGREDAARDYHLWLVEHAGDERSASIVAEITPRVRAQHPAWTDERLAAIVASRARVRVSGWLMLDQMHPEKVGRNRVTLWEVHPILHIDVQVGRRWMSLDSLPVRAQ